MALHFSSDLVIFQPVFLQIHFLSLPFMNLKCPYLPTPWQLPQYCPRPWVCSLLFLFVCFCCCCCFLLNPSTPSPSIPPTPGKWIISVLLKLLRAREGKYQTGIFANYLYVSRIYKELSKLNRKFLKIGKNFEEILEVVPGLIETILFIYIFFIFFVFHLV